MGFAARTFTQHQSLGLSEERAGLSSHAEQTRLAGAFVVPLSLISPDPNQPRKKYDATALRELAASIKEVGIIQPLTVRRSPEGDSYIIITGERRYRAAQEAGLSDIPCWVQSPNDEEILVRQVAENWQRADLHPFDLADTLTRMRDEHKMNQREIARRTGKPESEISRLLSLLTLSAEVQKEARADTSGDIGKRHLVAITHLPPEEQHDALKKVKEQRMTASQTERFVRGRTKKAASPRRGAPAPNPIRYTFGTTVLQITFRKKDITLQDIVAILERAIARARNDEERKNSQGLDGH